MAKIELAEEVISLLAHDAPCYEVDHEASLQRLHRHQRLVSRYTAAQAGVLAIVIVIGIVAVVAFGKLFLTSLGTLFATGISALVAAVTFELVWWVWLREKLMDANFLHTDSNHEPQAHKPKR